MMLLLGFLGGPGSVTSGLTRFSCVKVSPIHDMPTAKGSKFVAWLFFLAIQSHMLEELLYLVDESYFVRVEDKARDTS